MDGTSTVNGPDVVRISWQPCSVRGRKVMSEREQGASEGWVWMSSVGRDTSAGTSSPLCPGLTQFWGKGTRVCAEASPPSQLCGTKGQVGEGSHTQHGNGQFQTRKHQAYLIGLLNLVEQVSVAGTTITHLTILAHTARDPERLVRDMTSHPPGPPQPSLPRMEDCS